MKAGARFHTRLIFLLSILITAFSAHSLYAAGKTSPADTELSILWVLPFVGILLCIAIIPLINSHFWEKNLWWISLGIFCIPMAVIFSAFMGDKLREMTFEKALEYLSFILLLASLFTISGGILIKGKLKGTPVVNTIFLLIGSIIASIVGTTGASMLLIRPLIRANSKRESKAHVIIFFIFLVSNIGGLLTPLGDPPLFLGYLQGVPFLWTLRLAPQWIITSSIVLAIFFIFDTIKFRKEQSANPDLIQADESPDYEITETSSIDDIRKDLHMSLDALDLNKIAENRRLNINVLVTVRSYIKSALSKIDILGGGSDDVGKGRIRIEGKLNLILLAGVVVCIFGQGVLIKQVPGWPHFGPQEAGMIILTVISLLITPPSSELRTLNGFTFGPIKEVALLFAGIFAAMIPALYILEHKGSALGIVEPWQFFWASGSLSSFLDNAPTYLTFLSVAKGLSLPNDLGFVLNDGKGLSTAILSAISCGSVFMGANSYIGNGPNFMVRSIAEENGIKMPSFFGYMVYSMLILLPTFVLITFIFFM